MAIIFYIYRKARKTQPPLDSPLLFELLDKLEVTGGYGGMSSVIPLRLINELIITSTKLLIMY